MADVAPDLAAVTQVHQEVWSRGDFSTIGVLTQIVHEELCEASEVLPGERVLDVACGAGNGAIAAARRFADAVGLDYVPALLERARERAAAERFAIEFVEGDAQELPFEESSVDVVLSSFGAMFAPDQERTAGELLRVCGPGGRIAMANWTPEGVIGGGIFAVTAKHAPPPPGIQSPMRWGTEEGLRDLLVDGISDLRTERKTVAMRWRSPEHWLEHFRQFFGPIQMTFERVGEEGAQVLEDDLLGLLREHNRAGDRALVFDAEYLEVVATRA
jgi:ubiquinone/menaquinone biosynthesis C-methylase UbiE